MIRYLCLLMIFSGLIGCEDTPSSQSFIKQSETQQTMSQIEVKPMRGVQSSLTVSPFIGYQYRSPFDLPEAAKINPTQTLPTQKVKPQPKCQSINQRHKVSPLEQFSLEQMKLRGVIGNKGKLFGLMQLPQGQIVTFQRGDYLGLNNGKVIEITSKYVSIEETFPNALGCEQQRRITLALRQ